MTLYVHLSYARYAIANPAFGWVLNKGLIQFGVKIFEKNVGSHEMVMYFGNLGQNCFICSHPNLIRTTRGQEAPHAYGVWFKGSKLLSPKVRWFHDPGRLKKCSPHPIRKAQQLRNKLLPTRNSAGRSARYVPWAWPNPIDHSWAERPTCRTAAVLRSRPQRGMISKAIQRWKKAGAMFKL